MSHNFFDVLNTDFKAFGSKKSYQTLKYDFKYDLYFKRARLYVKRHRMPSLFHNSKHISLRNSEFKECVTWRGGGAENFRQVSRI